MSSQQRYLVIGGLIFLALVLHIMFWRWGPGRQVIFTFFMVEPVSGYGASVRWGLSPRVMLSSSDIFMANLLGIALPIVLIFGAAFVYLKKLRS